MAIQSWVDSTDTAGVYLQRRHTECTKPLRFSCGHIIAAQSLERHTLPSLCIRSVIKFTRRCEESRIGN